MKTNNKYLAIDKALLNISKSVTELTEKVEEMNRQIIHLAQISKKVDEIHRLHFPKEELEKNATLKEKFLAEIILGIPRKRKNKNL